MEILKLSERQEQKQNYNSRALISTSENLLVTWHQGVFLEEKHGASFMELSISLGLLSWEMDHKALLLHICIANPSLTTHQDNGYKVPLKQTGMYASLPFLTLAALVLHFPKRVLALNS